MTHDRFRQFTPLFQLQHALNSIYLTYHWESKQHRVNHLDDGGRGFFSEVEYDDHLVELPVLRSFRSLVPLLD